MITGTILLTQNNEYLCDDHLPERPQYDKNLLKSLIEFGSVSQGGYDMLPPSLQEIATITHGEPQTPITVQEINYLSDILMVSRSRSKCDNGKVFRLDRFEKILEQGQIEIWKRRTNEGG
jgi:hypothetical protein